MVGTSNLGSWNSHWYHVNSWYICSFWWRHKNQLRTAGPSLCRNYDKYIIIAAKYTQRSLQISSHHLQLIRLGRLVMTCSDCNSVPNIPMFLELQGPINGYRASLLAVGIRLIRRFCKGVAILVDLLERGDPATRLRWLLLTLDEADAPEKNALHTHNPWTKQRQFFRALREYTTSVGSWETNKKWYTFYLSKNWLFVILKIHDNGKSMPIPKQSRIKHV